MVLYVIKQGGENFFFWLWLLVFGFQIFLLTIYPVVIAPIFNKCVAGTGKLLHVIPSSCSCSASTCPQSQTPPSNHRQSSIFNNAYPHAHHATTGMSP